MGSTLSTAHRVQFRRAWYLHYFDDKLVHVVRVVLLRYYPSLFFIAERWLICDDPSLLRLSIVQVNFTMRSA